MHSYDIHWQNLNRNNLNYSLLQSCASICADIRTVSAERRYELASEHQCTSCILHHVSIVIAAKRMDNEHKYPPNTFLRRVSTMSKSKIMIMICECGLLSGAGLSGLKKISILEKSVEKSKKST